MHNTSSSTSTKNMIADSFMNKRLFISIYYVEELNQYKWTIEYDAFYKWRFQCKRMYCIPNDVNTICKELFDIYFRDYELWKIIYNTIAEHYNEMLLKLQMCINPNKPDVEQVRFPDYPDTSVISISPNSIFVNSDYILPNDIRCINWFWPDCLNTNNWLEAMSSEEYEKLEEAWGIEKDKYYLILNE